MRRALLLGSALLSAGCATTTDKLGLPPLQTVPRVEVERYLGTWYEIASFPQSFQKGCTGTTAHYAKGEDGELAVTNRCHLGSLEGELKVANGRARVTDPTTNSRLEVSFFGPFWGEYWILELAEDYTYSVVGHPSRDYLWILGRKPVMEDAVYQSLLTRLREKHRYPLERLNKTLQPGAPEGTPTP